MYKFQKTPVFLDLATAFAVVLLLALFLYIGRILDSHSQDADTQTVAHEASAAEKALKSWHKKKTGASAFARGPEGHFGWTVGYNDVIAAKEDALAYCAQHGPACEVTEFKAGFEHRAFKGTIAPHTLELYNTYTRGAGAKAFAVSPDGAIGMIMGQPDAEQAKSRAKTLCETNKKDRPAYLADRPCLVVLSTRY